MKWFKAALSMLVLFPPLAFAGVVEVQARGTGLNEKSAVESALIQALRQVHGIDIQSVQQSNKSQTKINGKSSTEINVNRNSLISAKGQIAGYDIIDSQCRDDGCNVELLVKVYQYQSPGLPTDSRRKIAVLPFTGGKEFRKQVTSQVQDQLVQSRRFAVLDRENEKSYQTEKSLWMSDDVPISEKARMGKVLGLDYILVGNIEKAKVSRWTTSIALTGEKQNHVRTVASVRYQIIAIATRQVKWSDTVSVTLNSGSLDQAANVISARIAGEALNNIYPMRVVGISGDQIILNQGGKTVKAGSYFRIFALGENIIDPYTKESLGQGENRIANAKIVRVTSKMSYAKIISGSISEIKKMQIARKYTPAKSLPVKAKPKEGEAKILSGGGVML